MRKTDLNSVYSFNGNSGIEGKKSWEAFDYKSLLSHCLKKGKKIFVSVIVLQFALVQLPGQTTTRYVGGITHDLPDSASMEATSLPSRYRELVKSSNMDSVQVHSVPAVVPFAAPLNSTFAVGTIAGNADVTPTGGASYQIPIDVPEGAAGFKPSVAVSYNSQGGYGIMGYGWSLSAYSAITRCGKTYYFDNAAEAPSLSNTDNLMLDGQRLMLISGSNLTSGAKYRLEYDPFTDISFKNVGSYMGFVVRTKDGGSREYGLTTNSNIETSGGVTLSWLLSKITDKSGNTITYEYEEVVGNGEFYLRKIQYAGNRSIQFGYETRSDKQKTYFAGTVINNNKILKSISTYIGQTLIKRYDFNYAFDGLYSKLTEIIENGQNGERYNSTQVGYGYPESGEEYFSFVSPNRQGNTPLFADFNGDGKTDFLSYPNKTSYTTSDKATLYLAQTMYGSVSFYKKCEIPMQFSGSVFQGFLLADLNGDGMTDVVNISKAANGTYRYNFYMFDGEELTYNYLGFNTNGKDALVGDFNGDGKQEILVIENKKVFNGSGSEIASGGIDNWGSVYVKDYYPNNRYLCDFNGNGKTDILVMNSSGGWVYELSGNSFVRLASFNTTDIRNYYFPYFGDFNGDGKTDILIQNNNNINDVSILFSTGKGFVKQAISNADIKAKVFIGDFNRDGKSDIFHMENVGGTMRMKVGIFNGTNFTTTSYSTLLTPSDFNVPYEYDKFLFQVADFDGDGRSEFCCARYVDTYIIHTFPNNQNLLAKNITDGLGAYTSFEYAPITDAGVCTNTGNSASFPVSGHLFPMQVVQSMSKSAGGYYDHAYYRYKNPRVHVQGKGFLGFGEIECDYYYKDRKTTTQYGYNSIYYYPYVNQQKVATRSGTNLSLSVYENSSVYQGNKRVTPYVRKQTDTDYLTNTVTVVECKQTDSMGNPLKVETKYGSDVTETVSYNYFNMGVDNLWIYGLPLSMEKKTERGGESWIEKQTFAYNSRYLPETVISYTNDGTKKVSEEGYSYDSFGNIATHSSKTFSSPTTLETEYEYSTDGIYRIKITDPLSLATTFTYNSSGQVYSVTDPLNQSTTYQHDGMGRLIGTNYPDGTSSTVSLAWGGTVPYGTYFMTEQTSGKPTTKTYFDASGRELRNSMLRHDGSETHRDRTYDNAGRLQKESLPFKGSSASLWNIYAYGPDGRITSETRASGNMKSYSYSGRSVTITENGVTSTRSHDASGALTSVTDPAGTITYNLRADGQPVSIVAPDNITTLFQYDIYGRRSSIHDPSAGTRSFGYDATGNPSHETDALGHTKSMTYDIYNRLASAVLPEFTTTYTYNSYGQLTAETSTNGTSSVFTYDSYGRPATIRENAPDGKWLKKTFAYANGNVSSVQYESQDGSIGTEDFTYANGHNTEIKLNGTTTVWKLTEENALGQPTKATTGSINRTYSYTAYGMPTGRTAGSLQNFTYDFEVQKGNLLSRKDNGRNKTETFGYDNLNRLSTIGTQQISYAANGNITSMPGVGTLAYENSARPYQVTMLTPTGTAVPIREQNVTYTSYQRPSTISEDGVTASFAYNAGGDRVKMNVMQGTTALLTRYYIGNQYELDTQTNTERLYLGGDAYSAPAIYVKEGTNNWKVYYICRDYLGSITHIANSDGSLKQELSYDAWGRLRNPATQEAYTSGSEPALLIGRGYTGHEHLPWFGLINMNARLYDPLLGRFLSPDPYVQAPDFTQNFNRYSYALNNPLMYVDEDGEFIFSFLLPGIGTFIDAALWGAVIGGAGYTASVAFSPGGFNNWNWGQFGKAAGIGAISGVVTAGIGQMFGPVGSMGIGGEVARAYTHGFANGMISQFSGGDFMQGFAAGGLGSLAGSAFMMYGGSFAASEFGTYTFSGLAGGIGAELSGGNFWQGAAIGAMNAGLNHLQQYTTTQGARYFSNKRGAYNYMWDNTNNTIGDPLREVSGWELENGGVIVLPFNKNTKTESFNNALSIKSEGSKKYAYVMFKGKAYKIATHVHTHPGSGNPKNPLQISAADLRMIKNVQAPIRIIQNKTVYSVDGSYNYQTNMYNYKEVKFTW